MDSSAATERPDKDQRVWAMICHLSAFAAFLVPLGNLIAPLIIWLLKREEMGFVDEQGKEAVNFQITALIAALIAALLMFVLIGFVLMPVLLIVWLALVIIAAIRASEGRHYRYPFSLRLIK